MPVGPNSSDAFLRIYTGVTSNNGALFSSSSHAASDNLIRENTAPAAVVIGSEKFYYNDIYTSGSKDHLIGFKGKLTADSSLKISALRSATALQKYKEIQNSNDPDFANQVLAHFGIKPKVDSRTSIFIGGDDKTLSINPQVNTNFLDGGQPDIKAIGIGDLSAGCKFTASTYGIKMAYRYRRRRTTRRSYSRGRYAPRTYRRYSRRRRSTRRQQRIVIQVVGGMGGVAASPVSIGSKAARPVRARF